jgi:putative ABC transport system permease protein
MNSLWQDMQYAVRMLRKSPGFAVIALLTLALGIGANTIMFSIVNMLLLRPAQVKDADHLVVCEARNASRPFPYAAYVDVRDDNPTFSDMMAYNAGLEFATLAIGNIAKRVNVMFVSANYFSFLDVPPARGRGFLPAEEPYGAEPVAVLSHHTWQWHGADPNIVGSHVAVNGAFVRVVGVAPERFTGTTVLGPDLWLPLGSFGLVGHPGRTKPERAGELWNYPGVVPVGRLKPGLTPLEAQGRLQFVAARLKENHPRWWKREGMLCLSRSPRSSTVNGDNDRAYLSGASLFLMSVSAVVLLIACLNLANMAIVRGDARRREIAIRMAIGGGRLVIMRQLLTESLLLSVLGGAFGLILAFWGTRMINAWVAIPQKDMDLAGSLSVELDWRVLAATLGFCLIATVLSGMKPALRLSRHDVLTDLKQSRNEVLLPSGRMRRPRGLSMVCQIALSVVLVMGAALFTRSALRTAPTDSGFSLNDKLLIELDPLAAGYDLARTVQVYESLADRLRSMPGVQTVSMSASFPLAEGGRGAEVREYTPGVKEEENESDLHSLRRRGSIVYAVGPDYFETMEMPLLQGRAFQRLDSVPGAEKVAILDESLARKLRPDGNVLGCLVSCGSRSSLPPCRVIGIVRSLRIVSDSDFSPTQVYVPMGSDQRPAFIHLRVASGNRSDKAALLRQIPAEVRKVDAHLPVLAAMTLTDWRRNNPFVWLWGFGARLATFLGAMALFLASLGIYAVKGYMVASRTPEIGIRKALGATQRDIMCMVFQEGAVLTLVGLFVGLLLALAAGWFVQSLLYGVSPVDPVSIVVTIALLGLASLLASYIPARRAAKIDPMAALRCE